MKHSSLQLSEHAALAGLLRDLRLEAGLSQVQAAVRLGRPQTYISSLELGKRGIDLFQARDCAEVYGKTLLELVILLDQRIAERPYRPPRVPRADAGKKPQKEPGKV